MAFRTTNTGAWTPQQQARWDAAYGPKNKSFIEAMNAKKLSEKEIVRWKYQRYMKDYLRTVQAMDDGIGRVLDHLDATGLSENTVVIYSSDQGFYLGEHGWYDKRWMFEESFKMPFLIRWPGVVKPGSRSEELIQNIDYAPTFLAMAGLKESWDVQGKSFIIRPEGLDSSSEARRPLLRLLRGKHAQRRGP